VTGLAEMMRVDRSLARGAAVASLRLRRGMTARVHCQNAGSARDCRRLLGTPRIVAVADDGDSHPGRRASPPRPAFIYYVHHPKRTFNSIRTMAAMIRQVYEATGQEVSHVHLVMNNGVMRFPSELQMDGAHSFQEGVGALTNSAYHGLDLIAWLAGLARGRIASIDVTAHGSSASATTCGPGTTRACTAC